MRSILRTRTSPPRVRSLPLDFHKNVERRRRSRIDRARQLSMNTEMQKHILHATELYNLETERHRLKAALATTLGPPLARVVHDGQIQTALQAGQTQAATSSTAAATSSTATSSTAAASTAAPAPAQVAASAATPQTAESRAQDSRRAHLESALAHMNERRAELRTSIASSSVPVQGHGRGKGRGRGAYPANTANRLDQYNMR